VKLIEGSWDRGFALDKHTLSSVYVGDDEHGHPQFDTTRTDTGEALFQLKYRDGWNQLPGLADAMATQIRSVLWHIDVIVPMPASAMRSRQPVTALALEVSRQIGVRMDTALLQKSATPQLKNLNDRQAKDAVLANAFAVHDDSLGSGSIDVLLIDDLIHTGASMDAACAALRSSPTVGKVYVAVLTWR
jgi:predicted amidophosphoribosyltransferase